MTNVLLNRPTDVEPTSAERIHADHATVKRLGNWTEASAYEVQARSGSVVLDLRSPRLPKEIDVRLRLDRAMVKLLLPDDAIVEHWDLDWTGRGKVKDSQAPHSDAPHSDHAEANVTRVRLSGTVHNGEIRVNRGSVAQLAALYTREFVDDAIRAHKAGTLPTVDDPTRSEVAIEG